MTRHMHNGIKAAPVQKKPNILTSKPDEKIVHERKKTWQE